MKLMGRKESMTAENSSTASSSSSREEEVEWEMRPGGMLVQKRIGISHVSPPTIRLRIAFGALRYEVSVSSQATFGKILQNQKLGSIFRLVDQFLLACREGELKKALTADTGLQPADQRVIYKGRERDNAEFLDKCGIKHRSKLIVTEDPASIEKRFIEIRRTAKMQRIQRAISDASMELDKLAEQVSAIQKSVGKGIKVAEVQITTLIELLMRQAIKLDRIPAEGDALSQKNLQGKRVQKCVETLDEAKITNAKARPVIVTTKWETFDHPQPPPPAFPFTTQWEFFDS